jgi:hypothetical protein
MDRHPSLATAEDSLLLVVDPQEKLVRMRRAGAVITTPEAAMYEIAERTDTDEFKRLLKLVK